eukprot:scaffold71236_cov69-Phaeocystis_antarctica.AAC.8
MSSATSDGAHGHTAAFRLQPYASQAATVGTQAAAVCDVLARVGVVALVSEELDARCAELLGRRQPRLRARHAPAVVRVAEAAAPSMHARLQTHVACI